MNLHSPKCNVKIRRRLIRQFSHYQDSTGVDARLIVRPTHRHAKYIKRRIAGAGLQVTESGQPLAATPLYVDWKVEKEAGKDDR